MTAAVHPARSAEFLSRLHDGDLSPGERAHFESHRAHCVECRAGAAEFEAALALYRSSHPRPASPDLAARILRKLQSRGSRRPSFGPTFGIDLRWAGAFAAAVVATIVGSAIVAKNEATERRMTRDEPIRIFVAREQKPAAGAPSSPPEPASAAAQNGAAAAPREENRRPMAGGAGTARQEEAAKGRMAAAPRERARKDEPPADALRETMAAETDKGATDPPRLAMKNAAPPPPAASAQVQSMDAAAAKAAPKAAARAAERPGGQGAAAGVSDGTLRSVRLVVVQADGAGSPPELLAPREADVPATLRGRSFILIVDAGGRVREAVPQKKNAPDEEAADARKEEAPSLLSLRFAPGDRERRLLLRVE